MPYLTTGIQHLPQELKDLIFDFAFATPPPNTFIPIGSGYKPPTHLSISSALRTKTAHNYYSSSVFTFDDPCPGFQWLASVPPEYRKVVQHVDPNPLGGEEALPRVGCEGEVLPLSTVGGEMMGVEQLLEELRESWKPREGVLRVSVRMAVREAERGRVYG